LDLWQNFASGGNSLQKIEEEDMESPVRHMKNPPTKPYSGKRKLNKEIGA